MSEREQHERRVEMVAKSEQPQLSLKEIRELQGQILYLALDVRRASAAAEAFLRSAATLLGEQLPPSSRALCDKAMARS
jgi:hypothetical protein